MGQLQEKHGMTLLGNTPPGTCPMCAVAHDPEMPHNQQSLAYQYKFYDQHGRFPTWADAMAHCSDEVKAQWREALAEHGIIVGEEPQAEGEEIEITITIGEEDAQ
ncbi:hypothetical protein [Desulfitobacterium sp.]|uniref:hypothetical protein n=1 Tax=Desulfitobacterium sp. TaxID=49981 RepID=UPI002B1FBDA4|nr:hypothetical protein [Desulfitobacterium sp.]MEA4901889.1 hypothetical protein [Desulfitobacterium sp.]